MSNGKVRRVVTGFNSDGRSTITDDDFSPAIRSLPERPNFYSTNIWRTRSTPADINEPDEIIDHAGVLPPQDGTVIRVIEFPPEPKDPQELKRQLEASFGQIFDDADQSHGTDVHPGMHETDTVDYAIILEGEIVAVLEETESTLAAGDILVQRGTNHAWSNRSEKSCKIVFVLIDGSRE